MMLELLSPKAEELWIESKDMIALHAVTRADRVVQRTDAYLMIVNICQTLGKLTLVIQATVEDLNRVSHKLFQ